MKTVLAVIGVLAFIGMSLLLTWFIVIRPEEKVLYDQRGIPLKDGQRDPYSVCLDKAEDTYSSEWDATCKANRLEAGCSLPTNLSDSINERYGKEKDRCLTIYHK